MKINHKSAVTATATIKKLDSSIHILQSRLNNMRQQYQHHLTSIKCQQFAIKNLMNQKNVKQARQQLLQKQQEQKLKQLQETKRQKVMSQKKQSIINILNAKLKSYKIKKDIALYTRLKAQKGHLIINKQKIHNLQQKKLFRNKVFNQTKRSYINVWKFRQNYSQSARKSIQNNIRSLNMTVKSRQSQLQKLQKDQAQLAKILLQSQSESRILRKKKALLIPSIIK